MRLRRPRFALVLTGLVALAALAIVLVGGGGSASPGGGGGSLKFGSPGGPGRACQTTHAAVRVTAHSAIVVSSTATVPIRVTETATGPRGTAVVTRTASFSDRARTMRPLSVTYRAVARATACLRASSLTAARALAIRRAYTVALARARRQALTAAHHRLRALQRSLYGSVAAAARSQAVRQARALADAARPNLAQTARRQALNRVGG